MKTFSAFLALLLSAPAASSAQGETATFAYDANGNRTSKVEVGVSWTYLYDARNFLVEVRRDGLLIERYSYDSDGHRIRKVGSGQVVRYIWDDDHVLLETDEFGLTVAKYSYGAGRLLSIEQSSEGLGFYLLDGSGSPTGISRTDGAIQVRYQWDAWGNLRRSVGSSSSSFAFTGHQFDEPTGLYYAGARYYDSELGIFLTVDPLIGDPENPPSLHRYLYAYSNPTVYWDPNGLESVRQWLDVEGDFMADRIATGVAKYTLYQAWNALTFGFLGEHDQAYETSSGSDYVARTGIALGKAGTRAYVAAQTAGAGLAFSEAAGLGSVAAAGVTGSAVGFAQTATDDAFNLAEGNPTHSASDYAVNTLAGGALGALGSELASRRAAIAAAPAAPIEAAAVPESGSARARVLERLAESQAARESSNFGTYARNTTGTIGESSGGPAASVTIERSGAIAELGSAPPYRPRAIEAELRARYPDRVTSRTLAPPGGANATRAAHPAGVLIDERGFPVFDDVAAFENRLEVSVAQVPSRKLHFQSATRSLAEAQRRGEVRSSLFTPEQQMAILAGSEKIPGYTWHHHQDFGRMQLVPTPIHRAVGHVGGFRLWY